MAVLLRPGVRALYTVSGGAPPATLERLTIAEDGPDQYLSANSWPCQPPFDEIGWYEDELPPAMREGIDLAAHGIEAHAEPTTGDAGREFFAVRVDGRVVTCTTAPSRIPQDWQRLRRRLRAAIAWLREHPASTLRAELAWVAGRGLVVRLHNRGTRAFSLASGPGVEVELRAARREPSGDPLGVPESLMTRADLPLVRGLDESALEPGAWRELEFGTAVDVERLVGPASPKTQPIDGLLRVCFPRVDDEGRPFVQEGWLWTTAANPPASD